MKKEKQLKTFGNLIAKTIQTWNQANLIKITVIMSRGKRAIHH